MSRAIPLLRSPPFPWIAPRRAAVSLPGHPGAAWAGAPDQLFALIREARVGGAFWRPASGDAPDPWARLGDPRPIEVHADDELAALALIAGRSVRLIGEGRFGGNGRVDASVVVRALTDETRYRNPFSGEWSTVEEAVAVLADWRAIIDANHPVAALVGIAGWKRREIQRLFWAPRAQPLRVTGSVTKAVAVTRPGCVIAAWPSREPAGLRPRAAQAGAAVASVEDGFIRSIGLGSGLHPPQSIVVDRRGIHYDPGRASDLEHLLQSTDFTPDLLARARALRRSIVEGGVAKYGSRPGATRLPARRTGSRLVLVPGQVADDLSVRLGGGAVAGNLDLLARTRTEEPEAEIWYRPHPDVEAGHRRGALADADACRYADRVVRGHGMAELLAHVDGVSVLTSLTGFEALLRGRDVTVHGAPFYAGWGLTRDLGAVPPRRMRRLSLDQLIAGTLILYPRYLDPSTGLPCSVELLVERLRLQAAARPSVLTLLRAAQGRLRRGWTSRAGART